MKCKILNDDFLMKNIFNANAKIFLMLEIDENA